VNEEVVFVDAVTKRYGPVVAVNDVSLRVRRGEVYSLIGANGAGKSTLLRMIVGLAQPDSGKIFICGDDLSTKIVTTRRHLGYLPEELIFYDRLTGREYLELVAGLKDADPESISPEVSFFELEAVQDKEVGGYSLGMRKKLGLAAAFLGAADLLLLDEPLNGLDVEMMRKLRLRLDDVRAAGRSVLVSSHVMSFVERVSDRIGVISGGRLVAEGTPSELRRQSGIGQASFEDVFFALAG
jgi:ABC-type multidrug transport system ATPase subunit